MWFALSVAAVSPAPASARSPGRPLGVRLLALLVPLLVLSVQPRASLPFAAPGQHAIADHAPRAESHALRVEVAPRVAPSPALGRVPCAPPVLAALRWPSPRPALVRPPPARAPLGQSLGHFHGQRRIPRMNSDEPLRA